MTIFFTSDPHYFHSNVIKYCNRPFNNVIDMNETLIKNFNSKVSPNDTTYFIGDISFAKNVDDTIDILNRLNGKKILIHGNHDKKLIRNKDFVKCFEYVTPLAEICIDNIHITLCHYAMLTWNKSHYGAYMLHGHSHGSLADDNTQLRIDVGVDCHNFYPISFDEVKAIMAKKSFKPIDHHGSI